MQRWFERDDWKEMSVCFLDAYACMYKMHTNARLEPRNYTHVSAHRGFVIQITLKEEMGDKTSY